MNCRAFVVARMELQGNGCAEFFFLLKGLRVELEGFGVLN
jgi:hypothetical protein